MERLTCGKGKCQESAINFCFNCKSFLCRLHRIEDVKEQQMKGDAEHYYMDALQYRCNEEKFTPLYCREHPNQMLSGRCINCLHFACDLCLPQWCTKAAGRYHDYNMVKDFVSCYIDKVSDLRIKLQKMHERFLINLKEACRKQHRTASELGELINRIDRAVESQKVAITEEAEKLKQEIVNEMSQVTSQITEQILSIEKKEAMSRQLLDDMHRIVHTAGGSLAVYNYQRLQAEVSDLLTWKIHKTSSPTFLISQGSKGKYLDLELIKTVSSPMELTEEEGQEHPEEKKTEMIQVKSHTLDEQFYWGLSLLSQNKVVAWGEDRLAMGPFTETREGETLSRQTHDSWVIQMLPYGHRLLMLTYKGNYKISFQDTDTALYEFGDSPYYSPYYYPHKLMAVTCDHQLMVLQRGTQNLHVVHLESKAEKDLSLRSVGKRVYGIEASSDGKLVLLCEDEEERHSVIKYDHELQQVVWVSDSLLTDTWTDEDQLQRDSLLLRDPRLGGPLLRDWLLMGQLVRCELLMDPLLRKQLLRDWLHVAGYMGYLFIICRRRKTKILQVNLSDGRVVQEIPCDGLPDEVWDISLRGNTLAAASYDRIAYFTVSDFTEAM